MAARRWTNSRDMCKRGGNEAQFFGQVQRDSNHMPAPAFMRSSAPNFDQSKPG